MRNSNPNSKIQSLSESRHIISQRELNASLTSIIKTLPSERILSADQISAYYQSGTLVLDKVLEESLIVEANNECDRIENLVADLESSTGDFNLEAPGGGWQEQLGNKLCYRGQLRKVSNVIDHSEAFLRIALDPRILHLVADILGSNFEMHSKGFLMNKPPHVSSEKPWHQDGAYFPDDTEEIVTIWIPLQDVNEKNGCLYYVSGSNLSGSIKHDSSEAQLKEIDKTRVKACPVSQGGIVVMDKNTIHSSSINQTENPRRALIFRYKKKSSSINNLIEDFKAVVQSACNQETINEVTKELQDMLRQFEVQPDGNPTLGGGVSNNLRHGTETGKIEKLHLIINRVLQEQAEIKGIQYIDMGTDYHYPFYENYHPTQMALSALGKHADSALHYPSSYGLIELRKSFQAFMNMQFGVLLDSHREIMVSTGTSQIFDAISRSYKGDYVALPDLSLPTVATVATGNGAKLLRLAPDIKNGFIDLKQAENIIQSLPHGSIRFLYLNSPCNPTGKMATKEYFSYLVDFAKSHNILILHDMDSWLTTHQDNIKPINILEIPGAKECAVTVLSISKEFGLPGLRVGLLAGNENVISTVREHNSTFCVMIPEVCQHAAKAALDNFSTSTGKLEVNERITTILHQTLAGWRSLSWPEDKIHAPEGGFKYLVGVPPNIKGKIGNFMAIDLWNYLITSRCYVKFSSSRSFNPDNDDFIRVIIMQNETMVKEAFQRLRDAGIDYNMELPVGLDKEYESFLHTNMNSDF